MFKTKPEYVYGLKLENNIKCIIEALVFLGEVTEYDMFTKAKKAQDIGVLCTEHNGAIDFGSYIIKDKKGHVQIIPKNDVKNKLTVGYE